MEETAPQEIRLLILSSTQESEQVFENMTAECRRMRKNPMAQALLEQQLRAGLREILTKTERIPDSD